METMILRLQGHCFVPDQDPGHDGPSGSLNSRCLGVLDGRAAKRPSRGCRFDLR